MVGPVEIRSERAQLVEPFRGALLSEEFQLGESLWRHINREFPWESASALLIKGKSTLCGVGPAFDSLAIYNPLLLVEARFWGLTSTNNERIKWVQAPPDENELFSGQFPVAPLPLSLEYLLAQSLVKITYSLSSFTERITPWLTQQPQVHDLWFDLNSINAREFGYGYIAVDQNRSDGVDIPADSILPLRIGAHGKVGARKEARAGVRCNRISFPARAQRGFQLNKLPATLVLKLWHNKPEQTGTVEDLAVEIKFE